LLSDSRALVALNEGLVDIANNTAPRATRPVSVVQKAAAGMASGGNVFAGKQGSPSIPDAEDKNRSLL
jgi:hypothetical protein